VEIKKKEIGQKLENWQQEMSMENLAVFMIAECHLLWEDILGDPWGTTDKRREIPIKNEKSRQT